MDIISNITVTELGSYSIATVVNVSAHDNPYSHIQNRRNPMAFYFGMPPNEKTLLHNPSFYPQNVFFSYMINSK
jgi:hypothetical protein